MGLSSTPGAAVLERTNQEFSTCRIQGKICWEGEGRSDGGGGVRAAGATAATQAEPGREPVRQRGGAAMWVIPAEGPCSHQVPHRTEGLRTQGPNSSRTRMGKSTPPQPHPVHLCSSGSRPQNERASSRGSSNTLLHKGSTSHRQHQHHLGAFSQCRISDPTSHLSKQNLPFLKMPRE